MSQIPTAHIPKHPNEDHDLAYSLLQGLISQGTPITATQVQAHPYTPPDPYTWTLTQTISGGSLQLPPHPLTDPQHPPYPPLDYYNTPQPAQDPQTPHSLAPGSITRESLQDHIAHLLHTTIPTFNPYAITKIANHLAQIIISTGQSGGLGPCGLATLSDIFMCIGHEGTRHNMCIGVSAPGAGHVKVLLAGELCEKEGLDPLFNEELMEMCRTGFETVAVKAFMSLMPVPGANHAMWWM